MLSDSEIVHGGAVIAIDSYKDDLTTKYVNQLIRTGYCAKVTAHVNSGATTTLSIRQWQYDV